MSDYRRKLIEVALPLDAINRESAREKSVRHGHPSTMHIWWARRPLAACRAVLFASLVDDPSSRPEEFPTEEAQERERDRLFRLIEQLVLWDNAQDRTVLDAALAEIERSTDGALPSVLDPFCGGGSIPLEAERLGLHAFASDLNPVPVLINKALMEIPPKFSGQPPVNPTVSGGLFESSTYPGARGLAEDVRFYGGWIRQEALKRLGHMYPILEIPADQGGGRATVLVWIWGRTIKCPNPACGSQAPLVRSYWLSKKSGRQAWVEPVVDQSTRKIAFRVRTGVGAPPAGTVGDKGATCAICGTHIPLSYIRTEGLAQRIGRKQLARVAQVGRERRFFDPETTAIDVSDISMSSGLDLPLPDRALGFSVQGYGVATQGDLYTPRSAAALSVFAALVREARNRVLADAVRAVRTHPHLDPEAYADAVSVYLGLAVSRLSTVLSTLARWTPDRTQVLGASMQTVSYVWDFPEVNPFAGAAGDLDVSIASVAKTLEALPARGLGEARQLSAAHVADVYENVVVSTDPPYYDNIGYANLSDLPYVWLRESLAPVYPDLFSTVMVPKAEEIIAEPGRHEGSRAKARAFFEAEMLRVFKGVRKIQDPRYPLTIYYAFKQVEGRLEQDGTTSTASTGWETMLSAVLEAGFTITGTWPIRTERPDRARGQESNALASSVVLVCRPRPVDAPMATRREFLSRLRETLPDALRTLQHGNIAPVDLAQASIGPGMAAFSEYSSVVESDGSRMSIRSALVVINQVLDEVLTEQEGEYDSSTRWALAWFEQSGYERDDYGDALTLATAKNISVEALARDGFVSAQAGMVSLVRREGLRPDWDPATDTRLTVWEIAQYLVKRLEEEGESAAARLLHAVGPALGELARDLAYRLYSLCERKGWAKEAMPFNALVVAWPELVAMASSTVSGPQQTAFIEE